PYKPETAKWLLLGWIFRDAPIQRLRPMVASMPGNTIAEKQAALLNRLRLHVSEVFPDPEKWEWNVISEVVIDRLEGSRRAIKGTLFEAIVRRNLQAIFEHHKVPLRVPSQFIRTCCAMLPRPGQSG